MKKSGVLLMFTIMCLFTMAQKNKKIEMQRPHQELIAQDSVCKVLITKDSLQKTKVIPENIAPTIVAKSSALGMEVANADTSGLSHKTDSIKQILIGLQKTVSKDSVYVINADGTVLVDIKDLKTPTGKKATDWLPYVIMFLGIVFLMIVSFIKPIEKLFANSKNQLIQRFFATTSKFIMHVQLIAVSISGFCAGALGMQSIMTLIPVEWISVVQTIAIVCVSIAGLAQLTSNEPRHANPEPKPAPIV